MSASPEGTHLEPPTLLPCPFCGGEAKRQGKNRLVKCVACLVWSVPERAWSRRAQRPFSKEEREALEHVLGVACANIDPKDYRDDLGLVVDAMLDSSKGAEKMSAPSEKEGS